MAFINLVFGFLSLSLFGLSIYLKSHFWRDIGLDQLLFHLSYGFVAIQGLDANIISSFIFHVFAGPALILGTIIYFDYYEKRSETRNWFWIVGWFLVLFICTLPFWFQILFHSPEKVKVADLLLNDDVMLILIVQVFVPVLILTLKKVLKSRERIESTQKKLMQSSFMFFLSMITLFYSTNSFSFFYQRWFGQDYFGEVYRIPKVEFQKSNHKDLIMIYVESLERTFENTELFGENLLEPLKNSPGNKVEHFHAAPGTHWSMAGMAASQCSVPLKTFQAVFFEKKEFLPSLLCVSDVLAKLNYQQFFLVGMKTEFQGMKNFYENHSFSQIWGRDHWISQGYDPKSLTSWGNGLHDDDLLAEARKLIKKLKEDGRPFNIALMTADSHFTEGTPSTHCSEEDKKKGFKGAVKCTAKWVSEFLNWLKTEGYLNDTVVLVMGDHFFTESPNQKRYFSGHRDVYFSLSSPGEPKFNRNMMTHFDVAPTLLQLLGVLSEESEQFGLGISLFSKSPKNYESHYNSVIKEGILNSSKSYDAFLESK